MKKIRFIKYILIAFSIFCVPLSCFGAWYFENINHVHELPVDIGIDDIEENYSFSNTRIEEETYTIYFFPSVLYLKQYYEYLNGSTTILPENINNDSSYLEIIKNNNEYLDNYNGSANVDYSHDYVYTDLYSNSGYQNPYYEPNNSDETINVGYVGEGFTIDNLDGRLSRNVHRYDRFGYWPNLNYGSGRYQPIKIENVSVLDASTFQSAIIKNPQSDMSDQAGWYNLSFSAWTYIDTSLDLASGYPYDRTNESDPLEIECFTNKDIRHYFDALESLEKYADENNIIRLFPHFSCGLNYTTNDSREQGRRDAIKAYVDGEEKYLFYNGEEELTVNGVPHVKVASLINVHLDVNTTLNLQIRRLEGDDGYETGSDQWRQFYTRNDNLSTVINNYGSGLYNFYLFVGNSGTDFYSLGELETSDSVDNRDIDDPLKQVPSNSILYGKYLTLLASGFADENAGWANRNSRPYVLYVEKVTDLRLIDEIDKDSDIEQYVNGQDGNSGVYDQMPNFTIYNGAIKGLNGVNLTYSYAYVLRNVDFLEEYETYFQIRFGRKYIDDLNFVAPTNNIVVGEGELARTFEPYTNFFDKFSSNNNSNQNVSRPIDGNNELYSIYDFIILYNDVNSISLYAYRHENLFIKIFRDNPDRNNEGFAIHSSTSNAEITKGLIWKSTFASGDYLSLNKSNTNNVTIENALKTYFNNNNITSCLVRDRVSNIIVFRYSNNDLSLNDTNFVIRKNYIFYLDEINL